MNYNFSEADIERRVLDFMHENGINPDMESWKPLAADGKIHRFRLEGDKHYEKTGAYCIYSEGWPAGWVSDWRQGILVNWCYKREHLDNEGKRYFTDEQFKLSKEQLDKARERLLKKAKEEQEQAIRDARKLWDKCHDTSEKYNCTYLKTHKIMGVGIRFQKNLNASLYGEEFGDKEGELVIPLRNIDGEIQSLQFISCSDGRKKFFTGAPVKGAFFSIGLDEKFLKAHPDAPILLGEGYATMVSVYEATHMPSVAAMNAGNLKAVAQELKAKYPDRKIIITADNDWETAQKGKSNVGLHKARVARDELGLTAVVFPVFQEGDSGFSDWNDYAFLYGADVMAKVLLKQIRYECLPQRMKDLQKKVRTINASDLRYKKFDAVNWAIDGFIPAGLSILAGGPKVGKSLLALHLCLSVAIGGCALGKIDVEQGDALYLALEDTERRIQERLKGSQLPENCDLSRLDIVTAIPRQDEGGLDYIKLWLSEHPEAKLVVIDTLQKFRKQSKGKLNVYAEDYDALSELKKVADEFNVAFVVIHHLKKMSAKEEMTGDWINQLSGSAGITGCADTIISLRRDRCSTHGTLRITGRDVEEKDYSMKLDGFGWFLEGESGQELELQIPAWKSKILDYLKEHLKITPTLLSDFACITIEAAKKQLQRLCVGNVLKRIEHGVYCLA